MGARDYSCERGDGCGLRRKGSVGEKGAGRSWVGEGDFVVGSVGGMEGEKSSWVVGGD